MYEQDGSLEKFLKHCEHELELINLKDTDIGKSVLEFCKQMHMVGKGDKFIFDSFVNMVNRLIELKPLSPLQKEEMIEVELSDAGKPYKQLRHPRYFFVHHEENVDKYYDDRAIAFISKDGKKLYMSNGEHKSVQEITFPYYPEEKLVYLDW